MIIDQPNLDADDLHAATGWEIKPEGACKGEVCVPLPDGYEFRSTAERLGMAVVEGTAGGVWSLGPETVGGRALTTAVVPDLAFADLDGDEFHLSSLRGQKVVLVAWAPY